MNDCDKITMDDLKKDGYTIGVCDSEVEHGCQDFNPDNPVCLCYQGYSHPCCPAVLREKENLKNKKEF
jgi:hypothetical protein